MGRPNGPWCQEEENERIVIHFLLPAGLGGSRLGGSWRNQVIFGIFAHFRPIRFSASHGRFAARLGRTPR